MPRRKPVSEDHILEASAPLMLQPPRPGHRRDHDIDPYETLPGAAPAPTVTVEPLKRKLTKDELAARDEAALERKMRAERYLAYLERLAHHGGDRVMALADIYSLTPSAVDARLTELYDDVRSGLGSSSLADTLERNDLTVAARANLLRKHAYSANPAASLKALDMVAEMEGTRSDTGNFESYLRLVKAQKGR